MELGEKIRLITAAYHVAIAKDGLNTFNETITVIGKSFGISEKELREKKAGGGLELGEKIRLITAAYAVALAKDGLNTFNETIRVIEDRFGISEKELREKKVKGTAEGLDLGEKIRLITAAYAVALAKDGLNTFNETINKEQEDWNLGTLSLVGKIKIVIGISVKINPFGIINNGNNLAMISVFSPQIYPGDLGRNSPLVGSRKNLGIKNTGGIDFTAGRMPLEMEVGKPGGESIKFKINPAMLAKLQAAPGFEPTVIDYKPLISLKQFLDQPA